MIFFPNLAAMTASDNLNIPETYCNVSKRILSIDILRGIVMVVMALDHTRDFFSNYKGNPLDFDHASVFMFFTRWVTHFCAPVFVFLAGTSAFLSLSRGKSKKQASRMLFTRGLWLIVLEMTIVRFGWTFNLDYHFMVAQVIWAIGWSMIFLSALIFLQRRIILIVGLLIIFLHNTLDFIHPDSFGQWAFIWNILHQQGNVNFGHNTFLFVIYPLIPWIGVMAVGYCFGGIFLKPEKERNKWLYSIGISAILLFIILRGLNIYGDPKPWLPQATFVRNLLAILRCEKYPPSLLYLLMTLGPAITVLPLLEKLNNGLGRFFTVYGRVPLFYYVMHLLLIHSMQLVTSLILGFPFGYFSGGFNQHTGPDLHWGFSLTGVYAYWISAVLILYYPCKWFMGVKKRNKKWWISYL